MTRSLHLFLFLLTIIPAVATAQVPTGTISGRVTDSQDRAVGGATVTAQSPALQGTRTTTTAPNGDFIIPLLPPGLYTVLIESPGFAPFAQTRNVGATEVLGINATLQPAGVTEDVTVVGDTTTFTNTVQSAANFNQLLVEQLPSTRTILAAVAMAPSVHQTGPNNSFSIAGAMTFENLYLLNGVQIQDNLRGTPYNLFIEDAIQETTISTSGISAEYGRFTGGVINAITKSGGNMFSGSFRTSFRNDDWRRTSPFGESRIDEIVPTYEYTAGGPIVRDRTWFFLAGRIENTQTSRDTFGTNIPYTFSDEETRFEIKGTQALAQGHRLQGAYTAGRRTQGNYATGNVMDLASLVNRKLPQDLLAVHYTASVTSRLFFEAQYSQRNFTFAGTGGTNRDRVQGTLLSDNQTGADWWAPAFCAVCGDEERGNKALLFKGSYFLSTAGGSHNIVFGYDTFNDRRTGDNHQSASDWHVWATGSTIVDGVVYPVIAPGFSTYVIHWPILESSRGTNFRTHSLFVNDTWTFNRNVTFNLGLRYDKNAGRDASNNLVARDSTFSPRVGMVWDPFGTGRTSFNASYGKYVAAVTNSIASNGSPAGTPAILAHFYEGDPINTGDGPLVPSDVALQQVFDWFDASGGATLFQATIPGVATRIGGSLRSPHSNDVVVGVSQQIGRGAVRLDYINRSFGDFYGSRIDMTTGQVEDEYGQEFDLGLVENTNVLNRRYHGLSTQVSYRLGADLQAGGSYTVSSLYGNVDGENIASGPITSGILRYPEYRDTAWAYPEGNLSTDQRHRARFWGTYSLPWGRQAVNAVFGVVQIVESGTPYGGSANTPVAPYVTNPGYTVPPGNATYFFTARDAFRTEAQLRTDLSLNLIRRIGGARAPEVFANFQLLNVFNQFQLYNISAADINTTIQTASNTPDLQPFNPFTETPVEGVHWRKGPQFGEATGRGAYTTPRTFRFSVGVRF